MDILLAGCLLQIFQSNISNLSWIDVDVGKDQVDDGDDEGGAGDGDTVHQAVRDLLFIQVSDHNIMVDAGEITRELRTNNTIVLGKLITNNSSDI